MPKTAKPPRNKKKVILDSSVPKVRKNHNYGINCRVGQAASVRIALKDLIIRRKFRSLVAAADVLELTELQASNILFKLKPTEKDIKYALEIYNKGFTTLEACAVSGVSPEALLVAQKNDTTKFWRPQRW